MATKPSRAKKTNTIKWREILRLDESYTSLLLGIVVVLIGAGILITFFNNKHSQSMRQETSSISIGPVHLTPIETNSPTVASPTITPTQVVTTTTIPTTTVKPTVVPTVVALQPTTHITGKTYTVQHGDDLWDIAVSKYNDGYRWVDIAKANNLPNPSMVFAGTVLQLPDLTPTPKPSTVAQTPATIITPTVPAAQQITGNMYTVQKNDSLWSIAVRAYNNGYMWTKIAQENKLTNPSLIFSGNVLKIPR